MKILYDHQIFNFPLGGAPKYFAKLLENLPIGSWETTCLFSSNEYIRENHLFKTYPYFFKGQAHIVDFLNKFYSRHVIRKGNFDVFHQTNFGVYCLDDLGDKPLVVTYHDSNLSTIDPHPEIVERQRISIERADAVVAVSENTREDLIRLFPYAENKTTVIYHGIDIPDLSTLSAERICKEPYLLYVGRRSKYKNFDLLLKAFVQLSRRYSSLKLMCTDKDFSLQEKKRFEDLKVSARVVHIQADELTMLKLYRDAEMLVFPSLYEGFGMPILEAWSCHCPVVLSNASCFPEIAEEAGVYFSPDSVDELVSQVENILVNEEFRNEIIALGDKRVQQFSWKKTAEEHYKLYSSLI